MSSQTARRAEMGKRERNARFRRASLLEAAERLSHEQGWDDLSIEEITSAAGMAKGNFYTYFPSKQALQAALEARRFQDVAEQIPSIALSSDPMNGIAGYLAHLVDLASSSGVEGTRRLLRLVSVTSDENGADAFFSYGHLLRVFEANRSLRKKTPIPELVDALDALTIGILTIWAADPHRDQEGHRLAQRRQSLENVALRRIVKPWVRNKDKERKG